MGDDTASAPVPGARHQAATSTDVSTSYQEDRPYLIRFLLRHGAQYPEAEDAVHSAFVELMRSTQPVHYPRAWLRTVALRAFLRQAVPEQPEDELADRLAETTADWRTPLQAAELNEQQRSVLQALLQLPFKQRSVMAWHLDGWTQPSCRRLGPVVQPCRAHTQAPAMAQRPQEHPHPQPQITTATKYSTMYWARPTTHC
jgi:RNA polymerase sigma-70 factor (ECF subfamily)